MTSYKNLNISVFKEAWLNRNVASYLFFSLLFYCITCLWILIENQYAPHSYARNPKAYRTRESAELQNFYSQFALYVFRRPCLQTVYGGVQCPPKWRMRGTAIRGQQCRRERIKLETLQLFKLGALYGCSGATADRATSQEKECRLLGYAVWQL
jgi:hypothetical protein